MSSAAEVLIAGGGPAGAACAIVLARAGRHVVLVEREAAAREKVCGEFLGADALACLATLGLDAVALGGRPIAHAGIAHGRSRAEFALPFAAVGLPRQVVDEALLRQAAAAGAMVRRGMAVQGATRRNSAWCLRFADGAVLQGRHLVIATGKHSLRGFARQGAPAGWIGAKLHLRLRAPLGRVVLLPFSGGYAGLQPSRDGVANLCAALAPGHAGRLRGADGFMDLVRAGSPQATELLAGALPVQARPLAVAGIPYGFLHRDAPDADPTLWRIGDQFAVIPSFLGEGVAMALASGIAAAAAILAGEEAPRYHALWRQRVAGPMRLADAAGMALRTSPRLVAGAIAASPALARWVARHTRIAPEWAAVAGP